MLDDARRVVEGALAADPASARAHCVLAQVLERQRDLSAAAAEYRAAIEHRPAISAGRGRLEQGEIAAAVEEFRKAVRLAPDNAQAQRGLALKKRGAAAESRTELEAVKRLERR
ncbi:MAG: tetratricopeptide repeat protein [Acidobacteriota bacterium]